MGGAVVVRASEAGGVDGASASEEPVQAVDTRASEVRAAVVARAVRPRGEMEAGPVIVPVRVGDVVSGFCVVVMAPIVPRRCPGACAVMSRMCRRTSAAPPGKVTTTHTGRVTEILLIEDDPLLRRGMQLALSRHGHEVRTADTGEEGLREFRERRPGIVVLDLMLPGMDGFQVCRRIRAEGEVPVIMLTARGDDFDVIGGLEAGADDYVVKPVQPTVLDARVRAVLRRTVDVSNEVRVHRDLRVDTVSLTVTVGEAPVMLTPTEMRLLLTLSRSPERVYSRQRLLEEVWEHDYLGDSRLVDNCVQRLRAKIEADPAAPVYVQTVRGFGYRFGPV